MTAFAIGNSQLISPVMYDAIAPADYNKNESSTYHKQ